MCAVRKVTPDECRGCDVGVHGHGVGARWLGRLRGMRSPVRRWDPRQNSGWSPVGSAPNMLARMIANGVESKRARIIYPSMYALSRHFPNLTRWALDHLAPPINAFAPAEERPTGKPEKT